VPQCVTSPSRQKVEAPGGADLKLFQGSKPCASKVILKAPASGKAVISVALKAAEGAAFAQALKIVAIILKEQGSKSQQGKARTL
jgi:hypothetical protein